MELKRYYLTKSDNTRRKEKLEGIKYIVLTSSKYSGFSALKNRNIIEKLKYKEDKEFSCHYIIDTSGLVLNIIPEGERAICTRNENFDSKSISIMLCLDKNSDYTKEELNALKKLIIKLRNKYSIKEENVVREYDVNSSRRPIKFVDESILLYEISENENS